MNEENRLQFVFTEQSFRVDQPDLKVVECEQNLKQEFLENRFRALFYLGFRQPGKEESSTLSFLRYFSETFIDALTSLPELELAREELRITVSEPVIQQIQNAVPFAIGAEYVNSDWIQKIFSQLNAIYTEEIRSWHGSVQSFLAQHNEQLKVPERVFFHLVEIT